MVGVAFVALVVFGVPLAYVLDRLALDEADARVNRQASAMALSLEGDLAAAGGVDSATLARLTPAGDHVEVTDAQGHVTQAGIEPTGSRIRVDVDAPHGATLRLVTSAEPAEARVRRAVLVLLGLGLVGLAAAGGLAVVQARRLTAPLDGLSRVAGRLGAGDFSAVAPRSGLAEVDAIAGALDHSSARIADLVRAEREFTANASHQLRSALTGMRLRLEELVQSGDTAVRAEATAALDQARRLSESVDDLLRLARTGRTGEASTFDLVALVRHHLADCGPELNRLGRRSRLMAAGDLAVHATAGAVGQVIDILLANAVRHGSGTVTVEVHDRSGRAEVTVGDEGRGVGEDLVDTLFDRRVPDASGHGIGLPLARTLIEAEGGHVTLMRASPPVFSISLPLDE